MNKNGTVAKMVEIFQERFQIPADELIVIKKSYMGMSFTCDLINDKRNLDYNLINARVYEGSLLYVERKGEGKSKWVEYIEQEARKYTIKFNNPDEPLNHFSNPEYKHSVVIDQQSTLSELKSLIAIKLGYSEDKFLMKKGGSQSQEIKDLTTKVNQSNLMNNSIIYIEKGTPTSPNQYRILFSLAIPPKPTESKSCCYTFLELFDMPIDATVLISEIKKNLCQKINEMYPTMTLDPQKIRIRERNTDRLSKTLRNSDILKNCAIYERKMISIQILDTIEEEIPLTKMFIVGKRWNPLTYDISEPKEFIVKRNSTVQEIGEALSAYYEIDVKFT